jgi:hypothetical protein
MVRSMLAQRADIFADYDIDSFRNVLGACARIAREAEIAPGGRTLFLYER